MLLWKFLGVARSELKWKTDWFQSFDIFFPPPPRAHLRPLNCISCQVYRRQKKVRVKLLISFFFILVIEGRKRQWGSKNRKASRPSFQFFFFWKLAFSKELFKFISRLFRYGLKAFTPTPKFLLVKNLIAAFINALQPQKSHLITKSYKFSLRIILIKKYEISKKKKLPLILLTI